MIPTDTRFELLLKAVKEVGFPIVMALLLLGVLMWQLPLLSNAIGSLTTTLSLINQSLISETGELKEHRHNTERGGP